MLNCLINKRSKNLSICISSLLAALSMSAAEAKKDKYHEQFNINYSNAVRFEKKNNSQAALNAYKYANQLERRDFATLIKLGLLNLNSDAIAKNQALTNAKDYFTKAVSLNSADVMANLLLAKTYEELGDKEGALKYYVKASNLEPNNVLLKSNIGRLYFEDSKFKEAIEIFNKVILAYPDNLKARGYLGASLQATDNYMSAIEQYNYVLKFQPDEYSILKNLGDSWLALEQYSEAKETYDKAVEIDPNVPNLYADLAYIAHKQNDLDLAEENYEKALELKEDPAWKRALAHTYWTNKNDDKAIKAFEDIKEYSISGYIYQNKEDLENAVADYKKAIELDPKDHKSRYNLAQIYYSLGKKEDAKREYEAVLQQKPNDVEVMFLLASLRQELGDYSVAINYYKDLLDNYLTEADKAAVTDDKKLFKNNVQYNLGLAYKMQQNFEAAEESFEDLLDTENHSKQFTKNKNVYKELSFIKIALGKNTEAEKIINGWLREDPASVEARNLYADFLIHLSDERRAIEQLRLASALDTTINTRLKLANLLHSQKNLFEALSEYQTILQDEPENLNALQGAANNFKALGYKDEAVAMYKKIVDQYPNDVLTNYNYGLLLQENKDLEKAKLQYEKVAKLNPKFTQVYYVLGLVYWDLDDKEKAKSIWEEFMANSNDEDLKKRVKLIIDSEEFTQS
jgi:tetratricopeptide (TPR) repeat protein